MSTWIAKSALAIGLAGLGGVALAKAPTAEARVDPQMKRVLDAHRSLNPKPLHTLTPEQARKGVTAKDAVEKRLTQQGKSILPEKVAKVEDRQIDGPAGKLDVRVYTPAGEGPFPGIVYFHGGGFVVADLDVYDASPRALANDAKAVVVSVHYRQAPEHPFPAALDDAQAAFQQVHQNAKAFRIDPERIAVAGESAGGNLALGVSIRQKAGGGPLPQGQLLVYPFVSNNLGTASHQQNGQGDFLVGTKDLGWFWSHYLGKDWQQNRNPEAVPIYASTAQLSGLPQTLILVASLDPLLDEGRQLETKLKQAGVSTRLKTYQGVTHEFFGMAPVLDKAQKAQNDAGGFLRSVLSEDAEKGVGGAGQSP